MTIIEIIKNKISELTSYKFKVRIKHYIDEDYIVQYAYYRFIPIYYTIYKWLQYGLGYNPIMGKYEYTKKFASGLKTYEDVLKFKKQQQELSKLYPENKNRYKKITTPIIEQIL